MMTGASLIILCCPKVAMYLEVNDGAFVSGQTLIVDRIIRWESLKYD